MKKSIILFIIISFFINCCAPSLNLSSSKSKYEYYNTITQNCKGKTVQIITKEGIVFSGINLRVTIDSTSWLDNETKIMTRTIETNNIRQIKKKEPAANIAQGLFLGMAGGAVTGLLVGSTAEDTNDFDPKTLGAAIGGVIGGLIGLIYGITSDSTIVYDL